MGLHFLAGLEGVPGTTVSAFWGRGVVKKLGDVVLGINEFLGQTGALALKTKWNGR